MLHEVRVTGTTVDPVTRSPFVVLKGLNEELTVAIWIGLNEANAIMLELEQVPTPRPMTHDLLKNILAAVEVPLQRVVITDVVEGTFYALLELSLGDKVLEIDCRTSDAIALALRTHSPIFIESKVVAKQPKQMSEQLSLDDATALLSDEAASEFGGLRAGPREPAQTKLASGIPDEWLVALEDRVARLEENSVDVLQALDRIERRLDKPSQAR